MGLSVEASAQSRKIFNNQMIDELIQPLSVGLVFDGLF